MRIEQTHFLPFPRRRVWAALLDPEVLGRVLPGIEKFESRGGDRYDIVVKLGVASVKGTYAGSVEIADKSEPDSYRLRGEGKGAPGWAKGDAVIALTEEGNGTRIKATGSVQVGGTIAGVGQRMMDSVTKAMAKEFFGAIEREVAGQKQKVSTVGFGLRVLLTLIRDLFARLFGHATARA